MKSFYCFIYYTLIPATLQNDFYSSKPALGPDEICLTQCSRCNKKFRFDYYWGGSNLGGLGAVNTLVFVGEDKGDIKDRSRLSLKSILIILAIYFAALTILALYLILKQ
jgi:hypothetical protein